ncbi:MAG: type II CRISPR-associated endonuclease Cas1 [Sedimentisphaerales bacterium]
MIKKIIEISRERTSLSIKYGQLVIRQDGQKERSIPCEDIGVLLIDNPATNYTHSVFTELLKHNAAVIFCDNSHLPAGCLLPIESNTTQTESFTKQINTKEPVKKRLWRQLIRAKISHQAKIVKDNTQIYKALTILISQVRSGDPDNIEARASKLFWGAYIQSIEFRRDADGKPPNNLLNYGYMVVRAAVARAICSAGLLPSIGLHHKNKYNAFCLADDVIEPFRGFVEVKVKQVVESGEDYEELTQAIKARLLEVLYEEVEFAGCKGPLMVGLHKTAASLGRCFAGEQTEIDLPKI